MAAKKLHRRGIRYVVLSLGAEGALMVCRGRRAEGNAAPSGRSEHRGLRRFHDRGVCRGAPAGYQPEEMLRYALEVTSASAMHPDTGGLEPAQAAARYGSCRKN